MIRVIGDTFCDIIASELNGPLKLGGDVLGSITLCAGGSGLNTTIHGTNYCEFAEIPINFEFVTAIGTDIQVNLSRIVCFCLHV